VTCFLPESNRGPYGLLISWVPRSQPLSYGDGWITENPLGPSSNLPHRDRKPEYISKSSSSKQNMAVMASDGSSPHSPSLRLGRPVPSHRNANTPSPCWAPHFMAQERIMFSNPTPSKPHFSSAVTMSDDTLSALTPRLRPCTALLSCNLQPLLRCRCWVLNHLCSNLSQSFHLCWITEIQSSNLCVCVYFFLFCLCFSDRNILQL